MSVIGYINIALETFGGLLCLIILLCLVLVRPQRNRLERLYIRILLCNTALLFCDAAAWVFKGRLDPFSFFTVRIANFLSFSLGYILLALFTDYLVLLITLRGGRPSRAPAWAMWSFAVLAIGLVTLSQFNHMYYYIDEYNIYHRQGLFWISQMFGVLCMLINGWLLLHYRRHLGAKELFALGAYIIMPVAAMVIQMFIYGVAVLYLAITISILCIYISIQVEQAQLISQKELELEKARTAVMLSQIQPHFLYNALLGIKQLCDTEPRKASSALEHFSYYLRGNLDSLTNDSLISFKKEVAHTEDYLYLEKMRFEERVQVVWQLDYTDFLLPPLTLQPLVENAVRYGLTQRESGGTLTISSRRAHDQVIITIQDDGVGFDLTAPLPGGRTHTGIKNLQDRLRAQCGGLLVLQSQVGVGTQAQIILPQAR